MAFFPLICARKGYLSNQWLAYLLTFQVEVAWYSAGSGRCDSASSPCTDTPYKHHPAHPVYNEKGILSVFRWLTHQS